MDAAHRRSPDATARTRPSRALHGPAAGEAPAPAGARPSPAGRASGRIRRRPTRRREPGRSPSGHPPDAGARRTPPAPRPGVTVDPDAVPAAPDGATGGALLTARVGRTDAASPAPGRPAR